MSDEDYFGTPPMALRKQQQQQKAAVAPRLLQSPTSQNPIHLLGSNDDQLERAQARAARAAASRRKSVAAKPHPPPNTNPPRDLFAREQVMELFHNCIKLASENKITQKNTWDLGLIDHLSEIIRVESEDDAETNFQKASCTLEAGVKIYSLRVDSVHSEAYKVLGGINRVGREDDKENIAENDGSMNGQEQSVSKKETERKMSPLSTLESSFDSLNVKKFDVAFTVDPLYHQTSAQFDEGGAKGLLLNNLGVYGGCKVLFDSLEAPGKNVPCETPLDKSDLIDLSFAREQIEQMMICIPQKSDISPTLRDIVNQFDEDNRRPLNLIPLTTEAPEQDDIMYNDQAEWEGPEGHDTGPWGFENDDQASTIDDVSSYRNSNLDSNQEANDSYTFQESCKDDRFERIAGFLSLGLGFNSKANAWAGPDHWKYRKVKDAEKNPVSTEESITVKKTPRKQGASDVEFTTSLDRQIADILVPPKNPKSLLLPASRVPCNITLPEDCHYQPENLVKLFLLPNVMCLGKKGRKSSDEPRPQNHSYDPMGAWEDVGAVDDQFDDGNAMSDVDDQGDLISQPRQVSKIEVEYDKSSKQVDVHALKEILWDKVQESIDTLETGCNTSVSFKQMLGTLANGQPASSLKDVSPHLCFICLLHLANEHCLRISDHPTLDELDIYVPRFSSPRK